MGNVIERNTLASYFLRIFLLWPLLLFAEDSCFLHKTMVICYLPLPYFCICYLLNCKRFVTIFYIFIFICPYNVCYKVTVKVTAGFFKNNELQKHWVEENAWTKNSSYIFNIKKQLRKYCHNNIFWTYGIAILSHLFENSPEAYLFVFHCTSLPLRSKSVEKN